MNSRCYFFVRIMSWNDVLESCCPSIFSNFCFFGCQGPAYWIQMMTKWHAFKVCHGRSERFFIPQTLRGHLRDLEMEDSQWDYIVFFHFCQIQDLDHPSNKSTQRKESQAKCGTGSTAKLKSKILRWSSDLMETSY